MERAICNKNHRVEDTIWREALIDEEKRKRREYHVKNRDRINAYRKEKITCLVCDLIIQRGSKTFHNQSFKHKDNLKLGS